MNRNMTTLMRSFYERHVVEVARDLLGKVVFRRCAEGLTSGRIVETEAYLAEHDTACHSYSGINRKNATMFGPPGHAYVYTIHARFCLNVVTEPEKVASAVLVRAVKPLEGIEIMQHRRVRQRTIELTNGPAKLCEALQINRNFDGWDLTQGTQLWIAEAGGPEISSTDIGQSVRIGVTSAKDLTLRFFHKGNPFVSGPKRLRT